MIEMGPDVWAIFLGKVNRCTRELTDGYGDLTLGGSLRVSTVAQ